MNSKLKFSTEFSELALVGPQKGDFGFSNIFFKEFLDVLNVTENYLSE